MARAELAAQAGHSPPPHATPKNCAAARRAADRHKAGHAARPTPRVGGVRHARAHDRAHERGTY
eukprot:2974417-Pleurochrysis_carterae.AAC.1